MFNRRSKRSAAKPASRLAEPDDATGSDAETNASSDKPFDKSLDTPKQTAAAARKPIAARPPRLPVYEALCDLIALKGCASLLEATSVANCPAVHVVRVMQANHRHLLFDKDHNSWTWQQPYAPQPQSEADEPGSGWSEQPL